MGDARLAEMVLETMRRSLRLSITTYTLQRPGVGDLWRIDADNGAAGERWSAEHEDYYAAVCLLAELVGFELEDG